MSPNALLRAQSREPWIISAFPLMTHCSLRAGPGELQPWGSGSPPPDSKYRASQEARPTLHRSQSRRLGGSSLAHPPPAPVNNPGETIPSGPGGAWIVSRSQPIPKITLSL